MLEDNTSWLHEAADVVYRLTDVGENRADTWIDLINWCALLAGRRGRDTKELQLEIAEHYPPETHHLFLRFYHHVGYAISQNPHQNALLSVMQSVNLAPSALGYQEETAKELLLTEVGLRPDSRWAGVDGRTVYEQLRLIIEDINDVRDINDVDNINDVKDINDVDDEPDGVAHLDRLEYLTYLDDCCSASGGSQLIAVANVWRELCPFDFPNRLLLIAADERDPTYAMMSFIQLAIMGMACYVLPDCEYQASVENQNGLFAPPTAICSSAYAGQVWAERCWQEICNNIYGL